MSTPEKSYKFKDSDNKLETDNCNFLNISELCKRPEFIEPYQTILKYLKMVLAKHEAYVRENLCPTYKNKFMTYTNNILLLTIGIKY